MTTVGMLYGPVAVIVLLVGGFFAWRSGHGNFWKSVAEEKKAENSVLKHENDRLKLLTDITPILQTLDKVTEALDRHATTLDQNAVVTEQVFQKVIDMNGAMKSHGEAMAALARRLESGMPARRRRTSTSTKGSK